MQVTVHPGARDLQWIALLSFEEGGGETVTLESHSRNGSEREITGIVIERGFKPAGRWIHAGDRSVRDFDSLGRTSS